ncbi:MAG: hypothetical protein ACRCZF_24185 [Gemmataceae bacterium]
MATARRPRDDEDDHDDAPRKRPVKPVKKPAAAAPPPPPPPKKELPPGMTDDDANPYGVVTDEDTEEQKRQKKKVNFAGTADKVRKSARGPAMALLVLPSNLLIAEGALTLIMGIVTFVWALFPLVFTDVSANEEEIAEQAIWMIFGIMLGTWGCMICLGASKMQNVDSYTWAMVGAVLGIAPLLVGIFAIVALRDPRVIAGFEEIEGAFDDSKVEDDDDKKDDDDDEDDDDD